MEAFVISGFFTKEKVEYKFKKESFGETEDEAVERLLSIIGSKHGVKRKYIKINSVESISPDEATDPDVVYHVKHRGGAS